MRALPGDADTPLTVFAKLRDHAPTLLLESVTGPEMIGRYSFIGLDSGARYRALLGTRGEIVIERRTRTASSRTVLPPGSDPLEGLAALLRSPSVTPENDLPRFTGGAVGVLDYDYVRTLERLPRRRREPVRIADFLLVDTLVVFDRVKGEMSLVTDLPHTRNPERTYRAAVARLDALALDLERPRPFLLPEVRAGGVEPLPMETDFPRRDFRRAVEGLREEIFAGEIFQAVLSRRFDGPFRGDPLAVYRAIRRLDPSPYMYCLRLPDETIVGASPETFARLDGRTAELRPIAGTRPRGRDLREDEALGRELLADPKECAEHTMLVDLARNDLGRVSRYGTVTPRDFMVVEKYGKVMHIVSSVQGEMADGKNAFDLVRASFPAGTVTGAPKVRAMEILDGLERTPRGPYGGAIAYFDRTGAFDSCLTIRTAVFRNGRATVRAGAGIVADSRPDAEFDETEHKARAIRIALAAGVADR